MLKDVSTLGTFIRLKPLEPYPCSINPRSVFKVGQCKVEVAPWTMQQQHSQSVPVEVILQRLPDRQRLPSPPLTALPTHEHLRDLARELERQGEAQTPAAGPATHAAAQHCLRVDSQLPTLHTSFPVFLPWNRTGSEEGQHGRRNALESGLFNARAYLGSVKHMQELLRNCFDLRLLCSQILCNGRSCLQKPSRFASLQI